MHTDKGCKRLFNIEAGQERARSYGFGEYEQTRAIRLRKNRMNSIVEISFHVREGDA